MERTAARADTVLPARVDGPDHGELIVLLHGFPQTPKAWDGVIPRLTAAGFRVAAPWQRGYTPELRGPRSSYRVDHLVDDVAVLADGLGARRFHVVGHDWGAVVAWATAAAHPDRVASLTALSVPHPRAMLRALPGVQALRSLYAGFFQVPIVPELVLGAGGATPLRHMLQRSGLPPDVARSYSDHMALGALIGPALDWYRANGPNVLRRVVPVSPPTTFIWGRHDPAISGRAAEACAHYVDGPYRFVIIDEGHWLPELQPDLVAHHILERADAADASVGRRAGAR